VECKHRSRASAWLFIPVPPGRSVPAEYEVIRGVEEFTPWFLHETQWYLSEFGVPTCYKGTEVDLGNGHVESAELRHAFSQLQFAIPPLLSGRIGVPATSFDVIENTPFFFVPILVTNARLFVARSDFGIGRVETAAELADLSNEADCLLVDLAPGQDFFFHARRHLQSLMDAVKRKGIQAAEQHRREEGVHAYELPSSLAQRVAVAGDEVEAITNVSYLIVARFEYLSQLIQRVNEITDRVAIHATQKRPEFLKF